MWIGYSTKGNAKRALEAVFKEGTDYRSFISSDKQAIGGTTREVIHLSTFCRFKVKRRTEIPVLAVLSRAGSTSQEHLLSRIDTTDPKFEKRHLDILKIQSAVVVFFVSQLC